MNYFKASVLIGIFVTILFLMYKSLMFVAFVYSPSTSVVKNVTIEIPFGSSFGAVTKILKEKKVIRDIDKFLLLSKIKGVQNKVRAGEFVFKQNWTPLEVIEHLLHAKEKLYKITIPEGYNIYQIAKLLGDDGLVDKNEFLKLVKDKSFLNSLGFYENSIEGYLFPSTYKVSKRIKASSLIKIMYTKFRDVFEALQTKYENIRILSDREIVIMASMIEKETAQSFEMPVIASVFYNRLKKDMKLQSDPTTIYGIWERYDGNIRKKDLREQTPYNTYTIKGLPLGPISNPGEKALESAFNPAHTDYIFFVSRNDGTHIFTKTYKEHRREVYRYQIKHRR